MNIAFDHLTKAGIAISVEQSKVHYKQLVYCYKGNAALANDSSLDFYIKTDADFECHLRGIGMCSGDSEIIIKKASVAPTVPEGPVTVFSRHCQKDASTAAKTKIYDSVIGGTFAEVFSKDIPSGIGCDSFGSHDSDEPELILEKDKWYHLQFFNRSGSAKRSKIQLYWYEIKDPIEENEGRENQDLISL